MLQRTLVLLLMTASCAHELRTEDRRLAYRPIGGDCSESYMLANQWRPCRFGYQDWQLDSDWHHINIVGPNDTEPQLLMSYFSRRAIEVCRADGADSFYGAPTIGQLERQAGFFVYHGTGGGGGTVYDGIYASGDIACRKTPSARTSDSAHP